MASLLSLSECRALVKTSLSDADLQGVIERVEGEITKRIGAAQDDAGTVTIKETVRGCGEQLFVKVPFTEIVSITEDGSAVNSDQYLPWGGSGMIEHVPAGSTWGTVCAVTYKPADQRLQRKQATIDAVRLVVERTAMISESIGGEYSFTAPDWDAAMHKVLRKLCF